MRGRWLAFALLALTLAACDAGPDGSAAAPGAGDPLPTSGDDPTPPDVTLGTIGLQLQSTEPVSADWELVVQIIDPRTESWEERLDLTAMRQLVYLYLLPDTYTVRARVLDTGTGEELMYGEATGIQVVAQETTSVAIALEPSAALQVMVDLDRGGRRFGCEFLDAVPLPAEGAQKLFGGQRLELNRDGVLAPRYYLWMQHRDDHAWYQYASWTVDPFLFGTPAPVTFDDEEIGLGFLGCESAVDVGGRFYANCTDSFHGATIFTSDNGRTWRRLARIDGDEEDHFFKHEVHDGGTTWNAVFFDRIGRCALLADGQFNLFCGVLDYFIGRPSNTLTAPRKRAGIFHAAAPDAVTWRGYFESVLPFDDPAVDEEPNIAIAIDLGVGSDEDISSFNDRPDVFGAALRGGVYQLWFVDLRYDGSSYDPFEPGSTRFALVESVDRTNWSRAQMLTFEPAETAAGCTDYGGLNSSFAVFTTPDGVHVYSLSHVLWSNPTTPDYFAVRHWRSVD